MQLLMKVLKNLFGNNTKINASEVAIKNSENKGITLDNYVNIDYLDNLEVATNEFINGKRVYKKLYKGTLVNASSSSQLLFTIDVYFDNVWIDYSKSYINNSTEQLSLNWYYTTNDYLRTWINFSQKSVRIKTGGNLSSYNYAIIISYTKEE